MHIRSFIGTGTLVLIALGCRAEVQSPTEPDPVAPQENLSATATLAFWQLSAGGVHSCGVTTDNRAYCWGSNVDGRLGIGTDTEPESCWVNWQLYPCSTRPVAVLGGLQFRNVSAAHFHTCGVTTLNRAYCWGDNDSGQLGDGTTTDRPRPVAVAGGLRFRSVTVGVSHTCGLTTDNRAYCWGDNWGGQLGNGTTIPSLTPVLVAGRRVFTQVSAGWDHTCGLAPTKEAYCWGNNYYGQLGYGTEVLRRLRPALVTGGRQFRQLDAGDHHTCAVTTGYRALCWGNGGAGQLGTGYTYTKSFWPRAVVGGLSFSRLTAGTMHTCGETTTNRTYCWGDNRYGQLGDGTTTQRLRPAAVAGGLVFAQLSAGELHTCGKTAAAAAYCWGWNYYGQLGDGTQNNHPTPVAVAGATVGG